MTQPTPSWLAQLLCGTETPIAAQARRQFALATRGL